jgi:cytochrome c oxidase subunit 3
MSHAADENRPSYLGHHYDTVEQQFDSGKFGMWLFLTTEILLFAGLFCAYAVYRKNHPEVFIYAHHFLDTNMGALNTVVLIFSSFTMAWAVRASQLGQRGLLIALLSVTWLCGLTFMGVKYKEYSHKFHDGLLWGTEFQPVEHGGGHGDEDASHGDDGGDGIDSHAGGGGAIDDAATTLVATTMPSDAGDHAASDDHAGSPGEEPAAVEAATGALSLEQQVADQLSGGREIERSTVPRAADGPRGLSAEALGGLPADAGHAAQGEQPDYTHVFFGIYFLMTGLHGLHVIIGMIVIGWLIIRSALGHFGPEYFTPVDLGGLYWHLVDLIWIFLFPLLYLIH